jgi:hypothetical protein
MKNRIAITHEFVEFIPKTLGEHRLYVSIPYATAVHLCFCGCGNEVVTPLSPTDWSLVFNGTTVSLDPSIGSWTLACQSHYWIRQNKVVWAPRWSKQQIQAGRRHDSLAKERYYQEAEASSANPPSIDLDAARREPLWHRLKRRWL